MCVVCTIVRFSFTRLYGQSVKKIQQVNSIKDMEPHILTTHYKGGYMNEKNICCRFYRNINACWL